MYCSLNYSCLPLSVDDFPFPINWSFDVAAKLNPSFNLNVGEIAAVDGDV